MTNPLVSIIIPCYNQGHYIPQALDSVLTQTYSNWECIVVNDGSTDNTEEIIQQYVKKDSRFKAISISNSGVCLARNIAVNHSSGKFIYPLDSDNYLHPKCLEKCIQILIENPNIKLVYSEAQLFGDRSGLMNLPAYSYKTILSCGVIDNSAMFLREDIDRVGGYRLNMKRGLEDWDLWIALLAKYSDEQVVKINEVLYYYRTSSMSRGASINEQGIFSQMKDMLVFNNFDCYQKYYPDIFSRIQRYDYYCTMMDKPLIKVTIWLYTLLHKIKVNLKRQRSNKL